MSTTPNEGKDYKGSVRRFLVIIDKVTELSY